MSNHSRLFIVADELPSGPDEKLAWARFRARLRRALAGAGEENLADASPSPTGAPVLSPREGPADSTPGPHIIAAEPLKLHIVGDDDDDES